MLLKYFIVSKDCHSQHTVYKFEAVFGTSIDTTILAKLRKGKTICTQQ